MKVPSPVLGPVNKANKSVNPSTAATSKNGSSEQPCGLGEGSRELLAVRKQLEQLLTTYSPAANPDIHRYLENPPEADRILLDAWAKCGRNDRQRSIDLRLTDVARSTMSPLGIACLIRYARGWVDEAETRLVRINVRTGRKRLSRGEQERHQSPGLL